MIRSIFRRIDSLPFVKKFGSRYGQKHFLHCKDLKNARIVSIGAGEDITFDVEIAKEYGATILLLDPTPRAIRHVEMVLKRLGTAGSKSYSLTGQQDPDVYDLENVKVNQIIFSPIGVWNEKTEISFMSPSRIDHASYSAIESLKSFSKLTVRFPVDTIKNVCLQNNFLPFELLKLDIEGAQLEVLESMFNDGIFPNQILAEIDELNYLGFHNLLRAIKCMILVKKNGYACHGPINSSDLLFVKKAFLSQEKASLNN